MRAAFLTVLDMSLTAGFVIIAVLAVRLLLRKAPRRFSYALWAVVLFRLLCPVTLESPLSLIPTSQPLAAVEQAVRPNTPNVPNSTSTVPNVPGAPAAPADGPVTADPAPVPTVAGGSLPVSNGSLSASDGTQATAPAPASVKADPVTIAAAVWLCGTGALAAYSAVSLLRLRRRLVGAVPEGDGVWIADHISTPFVLGLIRPRIYLPSTLSAAEKEYILLHERTHIRRGDHIVKALAFAALAIHWFDPLVWLAFHLAGRDMEMSCDEAVLRRMDRDVRADYSSSLLRLSAGRLPVGPLAFGDGDPKSRIKNVMDYKRPAFWVVALAVIAVAACCVALFTDPAHRSGPGGRDEELTFYYAGDRCLYIFGSHYTDLILRWYFPIDDPSESDPTPLTLGNLFINDLTLSGGTSQMGGAFWTSEKRNAVKFNLLRFGEQDVTVNFTVALSETGGSIIEQEVWQHPEMEFPLSDDEAIALAQDFAYYIREAEAHYASGDYIVISPSDLSDLSADLKFTPSDDGEDQLLPNIRITGTVNDHKIGCDSFPGDRIFWYPYEYGDRYPLGYLSFPRCSLPEIEGRETLCACWTTEAHAAIRLDNSFSAMFSSQFDQKWYDVTVILSEQGGTVMERNVYGSGGTVTELSDEEAIALARFAAKLLTAAEDYYNDSGLDWSDRYQLWSEDLAIRRASSEESAAQWDEILAPYAPFGLTWEFNDPDLDGNGLTMWFDGQVVRSIMDEEKGMWIAEHAGPSFPEGAVEVFAVRRNGELTGLRAATEEEQTQLRNWEMFQKWPGLSSLYIGPLERVPFTYVERGSAPVPCVTVKEDERGPTFVYSESDFGPYLTIGGLEAQQLWSPAPGEAPQTVQLHFVGPEFLGARFRDALGACAWTDEGRTTLLIGLMIDGAVGPYADFTVDLASGTVTVGTWLDGTLEEALPFTDEELADMARTLAQVLAAAEQHWCDHPPLS